MIRSLHLLHSRDFADSRDELFIHAAPGISYKLSFN